MTPHHQHRRATPRGGRRGYILIVILGYAAVATSLGLAFLDANSTVMPEAVNYKGTVRAQYLAGSGVAMAGHYLMYPPTTVPLNDYWHGSSATAIDTTTDYFDVSVLRSDQWIPAKTDRNLYRIVATGVAHDSDGTIRARRSVTAEAMAPVTGKWQIPYAFVGTGSATLVIPAASSFYGDVHSNNALNGFGWCQSKVTATLTATWLGTGPPASVTSLAPALSTPSTTAYLAASYTIRGRTYTPYAYSGSEMRQSDAQALNAIDMSATNPGRIIRPTTGNFILRRDVDLLGTLVVAGELQIDDNGAHKVTAVSGFPAIVATSKIKFVANDAVLTIVGPVICGGRLDDGGRRTAMDATGPFMATSGSLAFGGDDTFRFNYDASRSIFWDIQNQAARQPLTVLSWKEN